MADTAPVGLQMDGTVNTQVAGNNPGTLNTGPALANGQHQETFTPTPGAFAGAKPTSSVVTTSGSAQSTVDNTGQNISTAGSTNVLGTPASTSGGTPAPAGTGTAGGFTWSDGSTGHMIADTGQFGTPDFNANTDPATQGDVTTGTQSLVDQQTALKQQEQDELKTLQQNNANDTSQLASTNAAEQSQQTNALGAIGGLRAASGQQYLVGLQQSHEQSMQILQQKYQQAVTAAQDAYNNNNFALADKITAEANTIKKDAQARNTEFMNEADKVVTQKLAAEKEAYTEGQAQRDAIKSMQTFIQTNSDGKTPFVSFGGSVFYASGPNAGQTIDPSQFSALGVTNDTVQAISDAATNSTTDTKNYAAYAKALTDAGGKPVIFGDWLLQQKRASASNTTIVTGGDNSTAAIDNVNKIIAAHPNDMPGAIAAINQRLGGPGASTIYQPLLDINYKLPAVTDNLAGIVTKSIASGNPYTQADFVADAQAIAKDNPYADLSTIEKAMVKSGIPMPGKLTAAQQSAADTAQFLGVDPSTVDTTNTGN